MPRETPVIAEEARKGAASLPEDGVEAREGAAAPAAERTASARARVPSLPVEEPAECPGEPLPVIGAELPVAGGEPRERADAARNRRRILVAAERLFAEQGVAGVSMDAIAAEACVGKGTLFRRFGDRAGLAMALVDERERAFQDDCIRGAPPLGPGVDAVERLVAFGCRLMAHLELNGDLIAEAESGPPGTRERGAPYAFYHAHVVRLIREIDETCDADYFADALLAGVRAGLFLHLRRQREMDLDRLAGGWESLVRRMFG
jgi:AcrR family transcriptional regulator